MAARTDGNDSDNPALLPQFYKYSVPERLRMLYERELINEEDYHALMNEGHALCGAAADKMIENVIGIFALPLALGLNLRVNQRDYLVPMVVEEPSIVAAVSASAKLCRAGGGFFAESDEPLLIGQVQIVDVPRPGRARQALLQAKQEIIALANSLHPKMVARGGGARDLEVMIHTLPSGQREMLVVHLLVDTKDAMGANLVNTMCEGVAPLCERLTHGRVFLRILSNLTDRALVRAKVVLPVKVLAGKTHSGEQARDGIILANDFAATDPYRAATHNKGIMNGIDPVAIATGNDWRAIEAAVHAFAGRGQRYTSLTRWSADADGNLVGEIELPLKVGTVGGQIDANPAVGLAYRLLGTQNARELACVMASVGLAQNLAALRALSTDGIQRGHMTLHARSCAQSAGAPPALFDKVVERLIQSGEIKVWKAQEILQSLGQEPQSQDGVYLGDLTLPSEAYAAGHGKVILLGEHAVVYGSHALAAPIPLAVQTRVRPCDDEIRILAPRWHIEERLPLDPKHVPAGAVQEVVALVLDALGARTRPMQIEAFAHVPRAMGLGSSAAMAVALIRAVARFIDKDISDDEVNRIAFACEELVHGTPSGLDNTLATFGQFMLFKKGDPPLCQPIEPKRPIPIVIGFSNAECLTATTVAAVRAGREQHPALYDRVFGEIDALTLQAAAAVKEHDLVTLGQLMNVCQGLLNALQVSTFELEEMVSVARGAGALGAKLTGGGGGGSIIALCPDGAPSVRERVALALRSAGFGALMTELG